uniref:25S rRNA (uridine-N(3))-methyltransferase BMT5-like domain-containing protein n=1 Tax=Globisporangium ultimum (strain ATCC 200006 / CBS 805.95 / DAOM BR144) TaxID=431595 RepID=K3W6P5_GLOUD
MVADALTSSSQIGDLTNLGLFARKEDECGRPIAHRVLVVGDGNFSFARAFLRSNADRIASNAVSVTATSLDTHDELLKMYPNSGEILDELKDGGVRVIHGVNATKLKEYPLLLTESDAACDSAAAAAVDASSTASLLFDRIVFNFPHFAEGGSKRNKIHLHRKLLRDFFQSAQDVLTRQGLVWVTLCAGQGGTALDTKQRAWGDTWQIVHCAADNGLIMHNIHLCPVEQLADLGYYSVGYKLAERGFWTPDSLTHVFCRENVGLRAQLPIEWSRGISFWIHEGYTEQKLEAILRECFPEPIRFSYSLTDQHVCPKTHRTSVTYTVKTSCDRTAFAKHRVNEWTLKAIQILKDSDFASSRAE